MEDSVSCRRADSSYRIRARRSIDPANPTVMQRRLTAALCCTLCLALVPRSGSAQNDKSPRRPKMPAGADTNSARVFYDFAIANLRKDPEKAADALYWSTRLEP